LRIKIIAKNNGVAYPKSKIYGAQSGEWLKADPLALYPAAIMIIAIINRNLAIQTPSFFSRFKAKKINGHLRAIPIYSGYTTTEFPFLFPNITVGNFKDKISRSGT
jgi:hypothetical protein